MVIDLCLLHTVILQLAAYTVQSMHARFQYVGVVDMTTHTLRTVKSRVYKLRLLFENSLCVGMQLRKCSFYSRADLMPDFTK